MRYAEQLNTSLQESVDAKQELCGNKAQLKIFDQAVGAIVDAYKQGGRLYIAGNGGSAADAQHLAAEFVSKLALVRAPMAAEALTVDTSILTAIGNDFGFDQVFARQISGKMQKNDVFLGITTSGRSPNIIAALQQCRAMGIATVVFTGHDGGQVTDIADYCVIVPGNSTSTIQELHIVLEHCLCACVENALFSEQKRPVPRLGS